MYYRLEAAGVGLFIGLLTGSMFWLVVSNFGDYDLPWYVIVLFGIGESLLGFVLPRQCAELFGFIFRVVTLSPRD